MSVAGPVIGDLDVDGGVDLRDAILALQVLTGINPPGLPLNYASSGVDVDSVSRVGLPEMIFILQYLAGLRSGQDGGSLQGKLTLSTDAGGLAAESVLIQLEGTNFAVKPGMDGAFTISEIPAGTYTLVAESTSGPSFKFRTVVTIKNGELHHLGDVDLTKTGSVSGVAVLENSLDNLGIDVYLAGTSFLARTARDGSYRIYYVPSGVYTLVVDFPGYPRAIIGGVEVKLGEDTVVKTVTLMKETPVSVGSLEGQVYRVDSAAGKIPLARAAVSLSIPWPWALPCVRALTS